MPNRIPTVVIQNFSDLNGGPYPSHSSGPIYDVSDNLTKVSGNHTLKFGVLYERSGQNDFDQINVAGVPGGTNNQNGRFQFTDSTGTGVAAANAAMGLVRCVCGNRTAILHPLSRQHVGVVCAGSMEGDESPDDHLRASSLDHDSLSARFGGTWIRSIRTSTILRTQCS